MTTGTRHAAALGTAAMLAVLALLCAVGIASALPPSAYAAGIASALPPSAYAAGTASPLPQSAYAVRAACPPPSRGRASCLALALVPQSAEARAHTHPLAAVRVTAQPAKSKAAAGYYGLTPEDLHSAYQLPSSVSPSQTIALVDAYNDLTAEADLATYDKELGLPECTAAGGCFEKVNQSGSEEATKLPFPKSTKELEAARKGSRAEREEAEEAEGWAVEISLDIETAHAVCQSCHIALVEASSSSFADLEAAEDEAVTLGAGEISNSWAGPECSEGFCTEDSAAFNHPGVVITAAAGDRGYLNWLEEPRSISANFPASSPHVIAVGGTRLDLGANNEWTGETVWNDGGKSEGRKDGYGAGGSGCSAHFPRRVVAAGGHRLVGGRLRTAPSGRRRGSRRRPLLRCRGVRLTGRERRKMGDRRGHEPGLSADRGRVRARRRRARRRISGPDPVRKRGGLARIAARHHLRLNRRMRLPVRLRSGPAGLHAQRRGQNELLLRRDLPGPVRLRRAHRGRHPGRPRRVRSACGPAHRRDRRGLLGHAELSHAERDREPQRQGSQRMRARIWPHELLRNGRAVQPTAGSGTNPVAVTAALTGLTANTTYHFRISATNAAGATQGADQTFKTLPEPPT